MTKIELPKKEDVERKKEMEAKRQPLIDTTIETWGDFWSNWKKQCAELDAKPKHIFSREKRK